MYKYRLLRIGYKPTIVYIYVYIYICIYIWPVHVDFILGTHEIPSEVSAAKREHRQGSPLLIVPLFV